MTELQTTAARLRVWLFASALPVWWTLGADHEAGGFQELLDDDAMPVRDAPRRARVQARQSFVYATAGLLGWPGPWRQAVDHGLSYLFDRYLREDGLVRTLVRADGSPADDGVTLYDQAFALFALGDARRALPDRADIEPRAHALLEAVQQRLGLPQGGLRESGPHTYQSNPHMHLLEACLAWEEAGGEARWTRQADAIAELAMSKFIDAEGGFLREFFDEAWSPAPGEAGRVVEPGHQFEWAWLLQRWSRARGNEPRAAQASRRLIVAGRRGIDAGRGVAVNTLDPTLAVTDPSARLWPQTERAKAALTALSVATSDEREAASAEVLAAFAGLDLYLQTAVPGLWRDKMRADGSLVVEPAPASSFYHIVVAIADLLAAVEKG